MRKKYKKPEVKVVDLSFNLTQLAVCHTPTISWPQTLPINCAVCGCSNPS